MAPSTKLVLAVCLLGVASGLVLLNLSFFVTADMFLAVLPYSWELVPLWLVVLAYVSVRAANDLIRHPELRTPKNLGALFGGLILLALAVVGLIAFVFRPGLTL